MVKLLLAISKWSDEARWHSWVVHSVGAIPLTLLFGSYATVVFFTLREAEQTAHELMANQPVDFIDHFCDVFFPGIISSVTELLCK